jgi:hypothetical protein
MTWFILFLLIPVTVCAHAPRFEKLDFTISKPFKVTSPIEKSIAIYSTLETGDLDYLVLEVGPDQVAKGPVTIHLGSLVPACKKYERFLIHWALIGPEQPGFELLELPGFKHKQWGIQVINDEQGRSWFEPYSRKDYYYQKVKDIKVTKAGTYSVIIWGNMAGNYVFEVGDQEIWPIGEIMNLLMVYPKLLLDREITDEECRNQL